MYSQLFMQIVLNSYVINVFTFAFTMRSHSKKKHRNYSCICVCVHAYFSHDLPFLTIPITIINHYQPTIINQLTIIFHSHVWVIYVSLQSYQRCLCSCVAAWPLRSAMTCLQWHRIQKMMRRTWHCCVYHRCLLRYYFSYVILNHTHQGIITTIHKH